MRLQISIPLAMGLILSSASLAAAQITPGYQGNRDQVRSEFRAKILNEFQEVMGAWVRAVNDEDAAAAARLYADDAFVHLNRPSGADEVSTMLEEWLPRVPQIRVGLADFDVSGELAYGTIRVQFLGSGTTPTTDGVMAVVMRRHGRNWRIRSQVIVAEPPRSAAGGGSPVSTGPGL